VFRNNTAGSANDTASTITNNRFLNNDEGVGLSAPDSTVTGNSFDEAVVVSDDDKFIQDKN
jgi:hypothetical protein